MDKAVAVAGGAKDILVAGVEDAMAPKSPVFSVEPADGAEKVRAGAGVLVVGKLNGLLGVSFFRVNAVLSDWLVGLSVNGEDPKIMIGFAGSSTFFAS